MADNTSSGPFSDSDWDAFHTDIDKKITDITTIADEYTRRQYRTGWKDDPVTSVRYPIVEYSEDDGDTWIQDESVDMTRQYEKLQELYEQANTVQSFDAWLNENPQLGELLDPAPAFAGIENVIQDIGDSSDEWAEASDFAAQNFGFADAAEMQSVFAAMDAEIARGIGGQTGFTDAERWESERYINNLVSGLADQASRDVDAILGETGSTIRAFQMADETRRQIVDVQVQYQIGRMQDDWARKKAEHEALADRKETMVQQELLSQAEYMNHTRQQAAVMLKGYATQLDAVMMNNQQLTEMYSADLEAVRIHAQIVYDAVNLEMGLNQAAMDASAEAFEQYLSPLYNELEAEIKLLDVMMLRGEAMVLETTAEAASAAADLDRERALDLKNERNDDRIQLFEDADNNVLYKIGGGLAIAGVTASATVAGAVWGVPAMAVGACLFVLGFIWDLIH
jgi:hypothetical protein